MSSFPGLSHIAITVTDLAASTAWYSRLFGSDPVLDEDEAKGSYHHTVYALGGGNLFGLHTHGTAPSRFDEKNAGLDHVSFGCADRAELVSWADKLDKLGIAHSDVEDQAYGSGVSFRDPDGIALEFFAPPASA